MKPSPYTDRYDQQQIDDYYGAGLWSTETFHDLLVRHAEANPDKVFVTDGTRSLTFRQLFDGAQRLAVGLHRQGWRAGDTAAVQLPSWVEFVQVLAALSRLGVIAVPIMPIYRKEEVGYVLSNAGIRAVFTPATFKKFSYLDMYLDLRRDHPDLEIVVVRPDGVAEDIINADDGVFSLQGLEADTDDDGARAELGDPPGPDEPFVIVYTSGNHVALERVRAYLQHLLFGRPCADRAVRLHRKRCAVRPLTRRPHHRTGHQRAGAHAGRGVDTFDGRVGAGPRHRGDSAFRLHGSGDRPDVPARAAVRVRR